MMQRRRIIIGLSLFLIALAASGWTLLQIVYTTPAFSKTITKYGAVGSDVRELQGRLKFLGYYKGDVDGDFGYQTLQSLKQFQSAFGLKADGIAGNTTKLKLWEATKNWQPGANEDGRGQEPSTEQTEPDASQHNDNLAAADHLGLSETDMKYMANAVYGEARGEPYEGKVAVAAVILNRVKSSSFPNTVYGVIFEPRAFTAVADGQIWLTPDEEAMRAVRDAVNGMDPTGGCIYYFNPDTATSGWIWTRQQVKTIGKHIFCI